MGDYRHGALRCPGCGDTLVERMAKEAAVDVCPTCSGIWIDWMDGEVQSVAETIGRLPLGTHTGGGSGVCPACQQDLHPAEISNVSIARCGSCAGAFVSRASIEPLLAREVASEDPWLTRLLERLSAWMLP